jgi:hypothetical protein
VCEKEKQVRGILIQTERRKREKGTQKQQKPKRHTKTLPLSLPASLFSLSFSLLSFRS